MGTARARYRSINHNRGGLSPRAAERQARIRGEYPEAQNRATEGGERRHAEVHDLGPSGVGPLLDARRGGRQEQASEGGGLAEHEAAA